MQTSDFYFDLPKELIAQDPLAVRSASRLLVLDKETGAYKHSSFKNVTDYLNEGDCLVLNNTKVIPARLLGMREGTGAAVEILLLKRRSDTEWETLVRPGKKLRQGDRAVFGIKDSCGRYPLEAEITDVLPDGNRIVRFYFDGIWEEILDSLGEMPLPPYITHKLTKENRDRYQTVYARYEGSAAAPTAGLHFTKELLNEIEKKGIRLAYVTLHVGLGTFRPVKTLDIKEHHMHTEWYEITEEAARIINETKQNKGKVICVGTTSLRTIESAACKADKNDTYVIKPCSGETDIFIYPGYEFKLTDSLITNFHLPESTLIMLVCALAGREHVLDAYSEAVRERYRFFSFGDAMLIR